MAKKTAPKIGRPTKYRSAMCDAVVEMGKAGKTLTQMACALDITMETMNQWRKSKPDYSDAIKRALQHSLAHWEEMGQQGCMGAIDGFNATSYVWQTKNRFPEAYRDKHEVEHSGNVNVIIGESNE